MRRQLRKFAGDCGHSENLYYVVVVGGKIPAACRCLCNDRLTVTLALALALAPHYSIQCSAA